MTPYGTYFYFGLVAILSAVPVALMTFWPRLRRWSIVAITAIMLIIQYGSAIPTRAGHLSELHWLIGYAVLEWLTASLFLESRKRSSSRWYFSAAIVLAAAPLVISRVFGVLNQPIGFAGLSYAVFRSIDMLIGIQDGRVKTLGVAEYFAYLFFFPTVSSGPIDRFVRFKADFDAERTREMFWADLNAAVQHIFTGFLYKYIIAYYVDAIVLGRWFNHSGDWRYAIYFYGYGLYLFFDFAGYSAFAVGVSRLFGIRTPENFNRPFLAKNIRDFWSRWHISLSTWFRDHIYMRFVMATMRVRGIKRAPLISAIGLLLSFGLMGVWHGTEWHYVLYGLYHAALLIGYERWATLKKRRKWFTRPRWWTDAVAIVITFHFVCLGFVIFAGGVPAPKPKAHRVTQVESFKRPKSSP